MSIMYVDVDRESGGWNYWIGATDIGNEGTWRWVDSGEYVGEFIWSSRIYTFRSILLN